MFGLPINPFNPSKCVRSLPRLAGSLGAPPLPSSSRLNLTHVNLNRDGDQSQVLAEIAFAKKRNEDRKVMAKEKRRAEMVRGGGGGNERRAR